jgi:hypothetical protein
MENNDEINDKLNEAFNDISLQNMAYERDDIKSEYQLFCDTVNGKPITTEFFVALEALIDYYSVKLKIEDSNLILSFSNQDVILTNEFLQLIKSAAISHESVSVTPCEPSCDWCRHLLRKPIFFDYTTEDTNCKTKCVIFQLIDPFHKITTHTYNNVRDMFKNGVKKELNVTIMMSINPLVDDVKELLSKWKTFIKWYSS